jgi:hypothetical protein
VSYNNPREKFMHRFDAYLWFDGVLTIHTSNVASFLLSSWLKEIEFSPLRPTVGTKIQFFLEVSAETSFYVDALAE